MTHTRNTAASPADPNRSDTPRATRSSPADERAERALSEPMTVRQLPDRRYVVDTDGGTYVVALDAGRCTCPDHAIRGARCKHLRRVALSVTAGVVPAPDERVGACAVCGTATFVPADEGGSYLCDAHAFDPGTVVSDRETGDRLVVTAVTTERADEYRTDDGRPLVDYASNAAYGAHEPAVEAVYVSSLRPDFAPRDARTYAFPASRLTAPET
ncbi:MULTISPECIES: SWIM zinc finger family protein [unclassified Halorubrum]|uniref:SWIM zinc finger family protein n=1 Tax=unclassified Halorubrum TaxID=2642239 RepID=UPI000EF28BD7|nr:MULTISPECIES: SWIM zinc finger family protein [unclassified Halorubrum]RLM50916.1 SWIM zinc finger family protein [Halorubrum sp. Atlit-28R]TKX43535.1 SWIM zinc finger family protein [Halorubrum sp. ARQ200]TKX62162.1 SWIM zinc finger family protein [Halorubrum sp. ASP1]